MMKKTVASPMIYKEETKGKEVADRMHHGKFSCSRHHWTFEERKELERRWNGNLRLSAKSRLSANAFADKHGIPRATLAREIRRGAPGRCFYDNIRKEWFHYEYSAELAQEDANSRASEKGPRGNRVTNRVAAHVADMLGRGFSVCTALKDLREAGVAGVPSQRAVYYHLADGSIRLPSKAFYKPRGRGRKGPALRHPAVCPGHRHIEDRPADAESRKTFGHWEMDTIVSGRGGSGGLLVMVERMTRYYIIQYLASISQRAVLRRLRELSASGCFGKMRSVTTDNGCEFLDQRAIDRALGAEVYYTHAYASWEKGSVENANRMVRRWYPKGTDLSRLRSKNIRDLQDAINHIARPVSLKGMNAHEAFQLATA